MAAAAASPSGAVGEGMQRLTQLSLVSKVCSELEAHLGVADRVLAEFVVDLGRASASAADFATSLRDHGAELPDYLARSLHAVITAIPDHARTPTPDPAAATRNPGSRGAGVGRRVDKEEESDAEPELYQVRRGRVTRVGDAGCFVRLDGARGREGLVHVSQMPGRRVGVSRGQEVFVKVASVQGSKLGLLMRDVDQDTGRDLLPMRRRREEDDEPRANPPADRARAAGKRTGISGIFVPDGHEPGPAPRRRMSSPERWEVNQLIASGVLDPKDYPVFDDDSEQSLYQEEELEIELNEDEPAFLRGQGWSSSDMSPVRIRKNPEGSLSRAAALQTALVKERRDIRSQEQRGMVDAIPKDLNRSWEDPMSGGRYLMQELMGTGLSAQSVRDWKVMYGKAGTYGQRSRLSIQEQRQSLPIFRLKNEVIKAVHANQALVVIGETGSPRLHSTLLRQVILQRGKLRVHNLGGLLQNRLQSV